MDDIKVKGRVIEALPSLKFRVEFADGKIMFCYLSGRMHKEFIRVIIGDYVEVLVPEQGEIGRIIKRLRM